MQVAIRSGGTLLSLEVEQYGTPALGTIVLIMGLGTQLIAWPMEFCEQLASAGFRVIRFDNRDVGLSTKFAHGGIPDARAAVIRRLLHLPAKAPYTLEDMALDVVGLLDALKIDTAHIVGASLGGMIAQILAARHAGRVRSLTCLMSSPGMPWPWESTYAARTLLTAPRPPPTDIDAQIRFRMSIYKIISGASQPFSDDVLYELAKETVDRSGDTDGGRRQFCAGQATGSLKPILRRIEVPTLLMHGRLDPLIPYKRSQELHRGIRGSKLLLFDQMGHNLPPALLPTMADAIATNCMRGLNPTAR